MAFGVPLVLIAAIAAMGTASPPPARQADWFCRVVAFKGQPSVSSYALRVRDRYCDGSLAEPHSGSGELAVIGVTASPITGNPQTATLRVGVVDRGVSWPVQLQGVAKAPEINYRFDGALQSAAQPMIIGAESAMTKMAPPLRVEQVAWSAWSDTKTSGRIFVPVVAAGAAPGDVQITVRSPSAVAYLYYSVESVNRDVLIPDKNVDSNPKDRVGTPISFVIPRGDPALVVVKITAYSSDGTMPTAVIYLIRPGPAAK